MGSCRTHLAAIVTAVAVLGAGCARPQPTVPVSAPEVVAAAPEPAQPGGAPPAAPPTTAAPPVPTAPPPFLQQILDTGWKLSALKGMPPRERPTEDKGQRELIYAAGTLRLYRDGLDSFYALVVDDTQPAYQGFRTLTSAAGFVAAHRGKYTAVVRVAPVTETERAELAAWEWTQADLTTRFGAPTYRTHNHGIGTYDVTYVPQGLVFEEGSTLKLQKTPAETVWHNEAEGLAFSPADTDNLIEAGKPSPNGKFRAGYLKGGGYWSQWIVVRETGKSEAMYHAEYFIQDFFWLDNRRLFYGEVQMGPDYAFHVIDVVAEQELAPVHVDGDVREFGSGTGNTVWYAGKDGVRHELALPQGQTGNP